MKRLYVLINQNLSPVYGAVQGGHAVAQYLLDYPEQTWNNNYLIYVKANLSLWKHRLDILGKRYSVFHEPDLGGQLTAIAVEDNSDLFKKLQLLK